MCSLVIWFILNFKKDVRIKAKKITVDYFKIRFRINFILYRIILKSILSTIQSF